MTALAEDESPVYPGGFIYTQSSKWMYGTQEYVTSTIKFYIPDGYKVVLEYRIQVTLPDNVNQYTKGYYVEITDTMSKGLTYNENVKVLVDGVDATEKFTISSSVDTTSGKTTLTIKNENILKDNLATNNSVITVYYTCTLNKDAVLGSAGNPNDVDLIYSNEPDSDGHGKTPKDYAIVFTYKPLINKVDSSKTPLEGAGFTLYKKIDGAWVEIQKIEAAEGLTQFGFKGIDDGDYKLVETKVPDGYNKIDDIYFTLTASHEETATAANGIATLTSLSGSGTIGDPTVEGFTRIDITTDMASGGADTTVDGKTVKTGNVSMDVVNKAGTELPTTGGIGTTIFYTLGAILVLDAAILLVTKKRMTAEN